MPPSGNSSSTSTSSTAPINDGGEGGGRAQSVSLVVQEVMDMVRSGDCSSLHLQRLALQLFG